MSEQIKTGHDVFISYSTKNKNVADAVVSDFEQHGIKCWYAPRDILPGEEWVTAITNALESSRALVLIFTEESNNSRQVMNEIAVAFNAGLTIVPFKLTDEQMSSELEYYLTRVHWLDALSKPLRKNIEALREYIDVIINTDNGAATQRTVTHEEDSKKKKDKKLEKILSLVFVAAILLIFIDGGVRLYKSLKAERQMQQSVKALEIYYSEGAVYGDPEIAREEIEKLTDTDPEMYYYLGMLDEREYSYEAATDEYMAGIEAGSRLCLLGMGNLYLRGLGVEQDAVRAKEYFDNAHFTGLPEAGYYEALMWEEGLVSGEGPDHDKALEYLGELTDVNTGNPMIAGRSDVDPEIEARAFILLGDMYWKGSAGSDKTPEGAQHCYRNALSHCFILEGEAYDHTGDMFYSQGNYGDAFKLYLEGEKIGNRESMKALGDMYYDGIYVDMDEKKAVEYYLKASDYSFDGSGNAYYEGYRGGISDGDMLNRIGLYYYYESDNENAAFFFTESGERFGNVKAMGNAGMAFENLMDYENAFEWYARAIDAGHEDSDKFRKRIRAMAEGGVISEIKAADWM